MQKQPVLSLLLVLMVLFVGTLTIFAFQREGAGLVDIFFGNIRDGGWNGQFNADFTAYLLLSGLWITWRNGFKPWAILLGIAAAVNGIIVFAPYLLYLLHKTQGDLKKLLVGDR